ncbi:Actin-related protein 1 [Folsomia candida]|uniref:Actin-related protein 1 n=1 Tax=Folsomia candida TaxID=158441 RepID=A0A226DKV5_FOLCA|nr:Actin-related protein 1 [Folsomia candida]
MELVNQPVVIDNGYGIIKAGFAGDSVPKCRFPNYVGRPKHVRVMAGAFEGDLLIGPKAEEHRGLLAIKYPMEHGIVTNWNDMERIWQYVYSKDQLQTFAEEPVPLTEAPLNPRRNREKSAEIFFETLNAPALFLSMQAVLKLFLLRKEGINFRTSSEFEIVRTIKERECYLSVNPSKDFDPDADKRIYRLSDGTQLDIGQARFLAPEVLFRPGLIREECEAMHEVLLFSIQKSDPDLRKILFQNIVLSGG